MPKPYLVIPNFFDPDMSLCESIRTSMVYIEGFEKPEAVLGKRTKSFMLEHVPVLRNVYEKGGFVDEVRNGMDLEMYMHVKGENK